MSVRTTLDGILANKTKDKVHVTLTYAQSLDARIAGKNGTALRLSCDESMLLTHWMRTRHDAILVGIGTALNDNPQLNGEFLAFSLSLSLIITSSFTTASLGWATSFITASCHPRLGPSSRTRL